MLYNIQQRFNRAIWSIGAKASYQRIRSSRIRQALFSPHALSHEVRTAYPCLSAVWCILMITATSSSIPFLSATIAGVGTIGKLELKCSEFYTPKFFNLIRCFFIKDQKFSNASMDCKICDLSVQLTEQKLCFLIDALGWQYIILFCSPLSPSLFLLQKLQILILTSWLGSLASRRAISYSSGGEDVSKYLLGRRRKVGQLV